MNRLLLLVFTLMACSSQNQPRLHVYMWSDAIKPELIQQFEATHHCRVILDTYDSNEALFAKLKLGASGYDLIFPSNYLIGLMAQQGLLQPINKLSHLKNIDPAYPPFLSPSKETYGIPYLVSYTGLAYRKDKVPNFTPTWQIFANKSLKGRMTMLNDIREALGAALRSLNLSANSKNSAEVEKAANQLISWKPNLAKFESEQYKNGIASAEFLVVQGYSGDTLQVMRENPHVAFAYPEEGTLYSIDYVAILKGAPAPDLAHAFIDFLLEPEVAKENMIYTCYLHPNSVAYALLPQDLQKSELLFPPSSVRQKAELIEYLGPALAIYSKAWDRVKSAD